MEGCYAEIKKTENTETKALYSLFKVLHAENENLVSIHSCNVSLRAISYFSSLFKKEAGKSFISYLTDYRMDIAAEMILNIDEKSYTIAEKVPTGSPSSGESA